MIRDEQSPCFVKALPLYKKKKGLFLSTLQAKKGIWKGEPTFIAVLVEVKPGQTIDVPDGVVAVLEEFNDMMPLELSKQLTPQQAVNHAIELEPGARLPSQASYRMSPTELAKLWKQFNELLEADFIQPSKASYGELVLFRRKANGSLHMCIDTVP